MKNQYQIKRKIKKIYLVKEPKTQTNIIKYRVQNELIKEYNTKEEAKLRVKVIMNEIRNIEEEVLNSIAVCEFKNSIEKRENKKKL